MKIKKQLVYCITAAILQCAFSGCTQANTAQIANELHLSLNGISDVTISYDEENVTFYQSDSEELVIKEYMTQNKDSYYASVKRQNDRIHISEGGKPLFKEDFLRYVEVYLPAAYSNSLKITTTDGNVDLSNLDLQLSDLRIDSTAGIVEVNKAVASNIHLSTTSGTLMLGSITADSIRLDSTSGTLICDELNGSVAYTSTSGSAVVQSASGCGSYEVNQSGELNVTCAEVTGDLSFRNKNGDISLTLPSNLAFTFEAAAKNGSISTTFPESITTDGSMVHGAIGSRPSVAVKMETTNGNIHVYYGE